MKAHIPENETPKTAIEEAAVEETAVETAIERPYTLRKLKDSDLWLVLDIIAKVFPDDLSEIFMSVFAKDEKAKDEKAKDTKKSLRDIGVTSATKIVSAIIKNMSIVQDEVYALLSALSGLDADEIKNMGFGTTPMMLYDVLNDAKNTGFFRVVSKLS